jgi:hypothetical protein
MSDDIKPVFRLYSTREAVRILAQGALYERALFAFEPGQITVHILAENGELKGLRLEVEPVEVKPLESEDEE